MGISNVPTAAGITTGWEKIAEAAPTGNVTTVTFTGLDINTDKAYMIVWAVVDASGGPSRIDLLINNMTLATSYYSQYFGAANATVGAGRENNAGVIAVAALNDAAGRTLLQLPPSGFPAAVTNQLKDSGTLTAQYGYGMTLASTVSNITRLDFTHNGANGIKAGSRFTLFRVKS